MKKIQAYQCAYCSKASASAGAMAQHEAKCKHNPNNLHKVCIGYHKRGFECTEYGYIIMESEWERVEDEKEKK